MVRNSERSGTGNETDTDEKDGTTDGVRSGDTVNRRSVLKLTGAAATAGLFGSGLVGSAAAAPGDYEEIVLDADEKRQVQLGDGETFENKLVDQRAEGAAFSIKAVGDNWTVRNVGFKGSGSVGQFGFHMRVDCPDGGTGLIENVYCNNKQKAESMGFAWERSSHSGTIQMRHTYLEGFGNNAAYMTNADKRGRAGGAVHHEYCYHVDNTPANYRPGGPGSVVKNSVSVIDDPNHERGYYIDGESDKARGTWPSHTEGIRMENVHFYTNPDDVNPGAYFALRHEDISDGSVCQVEAVDCAGNLSRDHSLFASHEGNTDLTVENYRQGEHTVEVLGEGVPTSPEMAASGERELPAELPGSSGDGSSGGDGDTSDGDTDENTDDTTDGNDSAGESDLGRTLTIDGSGAGRTDYEITVSGEIENDPENGTFGAGDSVDGSTATGFVNGGLDGYRFSGDVSDASIQGDATVLVDGEQVDFSDDGSDSGSSLGRTLTIDGSGAGWTDYEITVSGEIENDPENGTFGAGDSVDGSTATGFVNGGLDGYRFSGEISNASIQGDAAVLVDGEPFDGGQSSSDPVIDQYEVIEAGSKNPAANILVEWVVSDEDGDLSEVTVEVLDESGSVLDEDTTSVTGETWYDVRYFRFDDVDGQTFDVRATVTDDAGNQSTATETVQE